MNDDPPADQVVSFDDEELVLVDEQDRPIGALDKARCHDGDGVLHRAFSLFVFDPAGRLLLQQRAADKRLWPGYWSNSCCSHPRRHEVIEEAVVRRAAEELGIRVEPRFVYKFSYVARYGSVGTERELCSVYLAACGDAPAWNRNEIESCRWVAPDALDAELAATPDAFTPWMRQEWAALRGEHASVLRRYLPG